MSDISPSAAVFSRHAPDYDAPRRRLIPPFDAFYGAVVDVLGRLPGGVERVLDLGAGTGLLSAAVQAAIPHAELELLDGSEEMLLVARRRLGAGSCTSRVGDLRDPLPPGTFDAVVSSLAIHHLDDDAKRDLFVRVRRCLRGGGVFVNAEQVSGPSRQLTDVYAQVWREQCHAIGALEAELAGADERMRYDRCADTESQLRWLRAAGFAEVDCVFKSWRFAVMAAWEGGA